MSDQGPVDSREIRVECPFCRGAGKVAPAAEFATGGIMSDHRARVAALEAERDEAVRERKTMDEVMDSHDTLRARISALEAERDALRSRLAAAVEALKKTVRWLSYHNKGSLAEEDALASARDAIAAAEGRGEVPSE